MLNIRMARKKDEKTILKILESLELYRPCDIPKDFWVAEENGEIAGVSCLEDRGDSLFLSSVGVVQEKRNKGTASTLLQKILSQADKDIYLYTIIPDFFKKFGFEILGDNPPFHLPPREELGCENCLSDKCACMIRKPNFRCK